MFTSILYWEKRNYITIVNHNDTFLVISHSSTIQVTGLLHLLPARAFWHWLSVEPRIYLIDIPNFHNLLVKYTHYISLPPILLHYTSPLRTFKQWPGHILEITIPCSSWKLQEQNSRSDAIPNTQQLQGGGYTSQNYSNISSAKRIGAAKFDKKAILRSAYFLFIIEHKKYGHQ